MSDPLPISPAAFDLIVNEETGGQAYYNAKEIHPDWPGGASGVTIGIGYDCGYSDAATIRSDWGPLLPAKAVDALAAVAGIHGSAAQGHAQALHWISVPWEAAMSVFQKIDMPKWSLLVAGKLPNCDKLPGDCFGALVSLAFNRGAGFDAAGDRYNEMRAIKAHMVAGEFGKIPGEFRSMKRLWPPGTATHSDLTARREHEAALFESGLGKPAADAPAPDLSPETALADMVEQQGTLHKGSNGPAVVLLQRKLSAAGYRVNDDGDFGDGTLAMVERFQSQHRLGVDGKVGEETAAKLDLPHDALVADATPEVVTTVTGTIFPHDDTASLLAFYGKPWEDSSLLVPIDLPYRMTYDEGRGKVTTVTRVMFHAKAARQLAAVFAKIWDAYGRDQAKLDATGITKFSGTYNYRPIRGSSRLSCHAFGAAIDLDAEDNPLGSSRNTIPMDIVAIFEGEGFYWGGRFRGRKDNMHFQAAHE